MKIKHTPGPWRWEVNEKSKSVQLCGGCQKYNLTVMDFVRYGMNRACPRFRDCGDLGLLEKCVAWAKSVTGREHHSHWFKEIDHPDANIIAAAPELLDALDKMVSAMVAYEGDVDGEAPSEHHRMMSAARAAIAKAKGETP